MALSSQTASECPETVSPDACLAELERVLASRTFSKSARLRALLEYIGTCSIESRFDDLSEQQIGISVFQRPPGYNSTEDTIVRVTARHLRERLDMYYREEGQTGSVQMSVPKGSYVASFQAQPAPKTALNMLPPAVGTLALSSVAADEAQPLPQWPRSAKWVVGICALLVIALPLLVYWHFWTGPVPASPMESAGPRTLWRALFTPGRKTIIVPGDASLDAYIAWEQKSVSLANYTNQDYQHNVTVSRPPSQKDVPLSTRSVTPMADLRLVAELVRAPERMGEPQWDNWLEICYARDMVVANTHDNNLILIGSETFNPWVTLYQRQLDFSAHWDYVTDVYYIDNRAPKPGEPAQLRYDRRLNKIGQKAFTVVALTDNVQGSGRVLIVEGTSMGTTYGALSFLTDEKLWQPVMRKATDASGRLHNFEVVLGSEFVRGGASNTQIMAVHVH
jgi:hypothetical protein